MLDPDRRLLLFDALRPPPGAVFERAVGTTFSLDLEALITAPVAFALFDAHLAESGDRTRINVLAVMEGVRRHAANIDLFCQAGQIALPDRHQSLTAFLERSVHATTAPDHRGIFHPKVWAIRYRMPDGSPSYRLLVLSRNLTFDTSWDVMVQLDGTPSDDPRLADRNRPLTDFVAALPALCTRPLDAARRAGIDSLAGELSTVEWERPDQVTSFEFLAGGLADRRLTLPVRGNRAMIISPFVSGEQLIALGGLADETILVSRTESLDAVPASTLEGFAEVLVLDEGATLDGGEYGSGSALEEVAERAGCELSGLHAKVVVVDRGPGADFVTGSMNATGAGWRHNVEFGLLLRGDTRVCGVDAVLGRDGSQPNLDALLSGYRRSDVSTEASEHERAQLRLERLGRRLAAIGYDAWVDTADDLHTVTVTSETNLPAGDGVTVRCWPVTQPAAAAVELYPGRPAEARFPGLSLRGLTSFFAVELSAETGSGERLSSLVVVNATLHAEPADRLQRVLTEQLRSRGDVLRYLLLLLADAGDDSMQYLIGALTGRGWDSAADERHAVDVPVLESMLRALARNPAALDPIHHLVTDLQATAAGRALLPEHLDGLWPAVWAAREALR